jgi:hypothetical protein
VRDRETKESVDCIKAKVGRGTCFGRNGEFQSEREKRFDYSAASFSIYDGPPPRFEICCMLSKALMLKGLPRHEAHFHSQQGSIMVFTAGTAWI